MTQIDERSNPMSKLNEPNLDKKLRTLFYYDPDELGEDAFKPLGDDEVEEITSLIKELVAEAKPERFTLQTGLLWDSQDCTDGYHEAIKDYEANLLKALEEV